MIHKSYYNSGVDQHDVMNLLVKSQLIRTQQISRASPVRTPKREFQEYQPNFSPFRNHLPSYSNTNFHSPPRQPQAPSYNSPSLQTYSKSPLSKSPIAPIRRSPNYFKNKYQGYETKYETVPSLLQQLLQPNQPQIPQKISEQLQLPTIKELQDFLSQQIYKHVMLNNNQYKTESKNHYISNILYQHRLSQEEKQDQTLKKSVCVMLNHYLQFLILVIEHLTQGIPEGQQEPQETPLRTTDSQNYFKRDQQQQQSEGVVSFKSINTAISEQQKTEQSEKQQTKEDDSKNRQQKAHQFALNIKQNQENPLKFKSQGLQKKAQSIQSQAHSDDNSKEATPRLLQNDEKEPEDLKKELKQVAKIYANEYIATLFNIGAMKAEQVVKSRRASDGLQDMTISNQSRIKQPSNLSFGTDAQNEAFMNSINLDDDQPPLDPKAKERINIPSDEEDEF